MENDQLNFFHFDDSIDQRAKITAFGIGKLGSALIFQLQRDLPDLDCHKVGPMSDLNTLQAVINTSDMIFMLSGNDERENLELIQMLGRAANETKIPSIGIFPTPPLLDLAAKKRILAFKKLLTCVFTASAASLTEEILNLTKIKQKFDKYAMCHIVSVISKLISRNSLIAVDYANVEAVLNAGTMGNMAFGEATGLDKAQIAAAQALSQLKAQGVKPVETKGLLVCITGSSLLTMEEFNQAVEVVYDQFAGAAEHIVGLLEEEVMGSCIRVSILAVS